MKLLAFIITLVLGSSLALSQPLDSIPFNKVKIAKAEYVLGKTKIRLKTKVAVPFNKEELKSKGRVGASAWTLLTGLSTSSEKESTWLLDNYIEHDQKRYEAPILVNGVMYRERERVRDEDGSHTLETSEDIELHWNEGALGWIIHNMDTLGDYTLEIRTSPEDPKQLWETYTDQDIDWLKAKLKRYGMVNNAYDFLVRGTFDNQPFLLIYSGRYFRLALIQEEAYVGTWQDQPQVILISKHKIHPYVLLSQSNSDIDKNQKLLLLGLGQVLARNLLEY